MSRGGVGSADEECRPVFEGLAGGCELVCEACGRWVTGLEVEAAGQAKEGVVDIGGQMRGGLGEVVCREGSGEEGGGDATGEPELEAIGEAIGLAQEGEVE